MPPPIPVRGRLVHQQMNVTSPITGADGNMARNAYDLSLFAAANKPNFGILVVHSILEMKFLPNLVVNLRNPIRPVPTRDINTFRRNCVRAVQTVWTNRHLIVAQGSNLPADVPSFIHVEIEADFQTSNTARKHWTAVVSNSSSDQDSEVKRADKLVILDTHDDDPLPTVAGTQRVITHEFGHMLGLRDEYDDDIPGSLHINDVDSVMHSGEVVQARHYAPLAFWLTRAVVGVSVKNIINGKDAVTFEVHDSATGNLVNLLSAGLM